MSKFNDMEKWVFNSFIMRIENIHKDIKKEGDWFDNFFYHKFQEEYKELIKNFPVFDFIEDLNNPFCRERINYTPFSFRKYEIFIDYLKKSMEKENK